MKTLTSLLLIAVLLVAPGAALAQEADPELTLRLTRDFGYGGFTNEIQGLFSYRAEGPENLLRVEFYLDDELVASVDEAPFRYQFDTDDYPAGQHRLYAIGYTADGLELTSREFTRVFLTSAESRSGTATLLIPILALMALVMGLSFLLPNLLNRGKKPTLGEYGFSGGAICKQCDKPFPRKVWMPNMVVGKLARCPHCGKIAIVPRATPADLEEAEARLRAELEGGARPAARQSAEERLRRQIDESQYD